MIAPSFSSSSMNDFEPTLTRYRADYIKALKLAAAQNGGVVDISEWSNKLAFDVFSIR
jgi:cytochrome P450